MVHLGTLISDECSEDSSYEDWNPWTSIAKLIHVSKVEVNRNFHTNSRCRAMVVGEWRRARGAVEDSQFSTAEMLGLILRFSTSRLHSFCVTSFILMQSVSFILYMSAVALNLAFFFIRFLGPLYSYGSSLALHLSLTLTTAEPG